MAHRISHGNELPVPAVAAKIAADLSNDHEYAVAWTGQSNSQPWGLPADGIDYSLELALQPPGVDLDVTLAQVNVARAVGTVEVITVVAAGGALLAERYNTNAWLRLGTLADPKKGYAKIIRALSDTSLEVQWISVPVGGPTTQFGYIVREDGKWYSYENARVLTPYMPFRDIQAPNEGAAPIWVAPFNAPYRVENGTLGPGRRLLLPAPYDGATAVTAFSDQGLMLPITRREGADGYGISEIADGDFDGSGTPIGHPITEFELTATAGSFVVGKPYEIVTAGTTDFTLIGAANSDPGTQFAATGAGVGTGTALSPETFEFANAIDANIDLTGAFLIVDWQEAGGESRRTWSRIASNGIDYFTTDGVYLGDGAVPTPPSSTSVTFPTLGGADIAQTAHGLAVGNPVSYKWAGVTDAPVRDASVVTFDSATEQVIWAGHRLRDADEVRFTTTGTLPPELTAGTLYYVVNSSTASGRFQVAATPGGTAITFSSAGTPTNTAHWMLVQGRVYYVHAVVDANTYQIAESPDRPVITFTADGTGETAYQTWVYTCWLPHWKDNPYTYLPGPEFAYPNEDSQPRSSYIHFRARGQTLWGYNNQDGGAPKFLEPFDGVHDSRWGAMLPFAHRVGSAIGKRMNVVTLGVGSTPLQPANTANAAAGVYTGEIGWWNYSRYGYALALEDSESYLAKRLKRLITFVAPEALKAESNSKTLRYLAAVHIQGEADGFTETGREHYRSLITDYKHWLRALVVDNGFSPFEGNADVPFAQPLINRDPYMTGTAGITWSDTEGRINNAIGEMHTADEFAGYVLSEDLPLIAEGHYSGGGMSVLGGRLAVSIIDNLEHALSFGSSALASANSKLIEVANMALLWVGQGANQITKLSDTSVEAGLVRIFLPKATEQLLSMRQWSFTLRREFAFQIQHQNTEWSFAYVIPGRCMTPLELIAPEQPVPESAAGTAASSTRLVRSPTPETLGAARGTRGLEPEFVVEQSPSGHRVMYSNIDLIPGNVQTPKPFLDNELHPERLPVRPVLHYVDKQVDPDRYSQPFMQALARLLASMLSEPLIKGPNGARAAAEHENRVGGFIRTANNQESASANERVVHVPPWMRAR